MEQELRLGAERGCAPRASTAPLAIARAPFGELAVPRGVLALHSGPGHPLGVRKRSLSDPWGPSTRLNKLHR